MYQRRAPITEMASSAFVIIPSRAAVAGITSPGATADARWAASGVRGAYRVSSISVVPAVANGSRARLKVGESRARPMPQCSELVHLMRRDVERPAVSRQAAPQRTSSPPGRLAALSPRRMVSTPVATAVGRLPPKCDSTPTARMRRLKSSIPFLAVPYRRHSVGGRPERRPAETVVVPPTEGTVNDPAATTGDDLMMITVPVVAFGIDDPALRPVGVVPLRSRVSNSSPAVQHVAMHSSSCLRRPVLLRRRPTTVEGYWQSYCRTAVDDVINLTSRSPPSATKRYAGVD